MYYVATPLVRHVQQLITKLFTFETYLTCQVPVVDGFDAERSLDAGLVACQSADCRARRVSVTVGEARLPARAPT